MNNNSIVIYKSQRERIIDEFCAEHPWIYGVGGVLLLILCVLVCRKNK